MERTKYTKRPFSMKKIFKNNNKTLTVEFTRHNIIREISLNDSGSIIKVEDLFLISQEKDSKILKIIEKFTDKNIVLHNEIVNFIQNHRW